MRKSLENTVWVIVGIVAAVASLGVTLWLISGGMYYGGPYSGYGMMGYGFFGMGIVVIAGAAVSVILLLLFIYLLAGLLRPVGPVAAKISGGSAGEILAERYALGEITEEEFKRMKGNLEK